MPLGTGTTRSGKSFKSISTEPPLDFERLLLASFHRQTEEELSDYEDPFSLSPLSSPASTPPPSPEDSLLQLPPLLDPAPHQPSPPAGPPPQRASHGKRQGRANQKRKREELKRQTGPAAHQPRAKTRRKHLEGSTTVESEAAGERFGIAKTGYVGIREPRSTKVYRLEELVGPSSRFGFGLIESTVAILDSSQRVIAVLVGRPSEDGSWETAHLSAADLLEEARHRCNFSQKDVDHRRGRFPALATGISHGGGQLRPKNRANGDNTEILSTLTAHPSFVRLAGFASVAFSSWAPRLYAYYADSLKALIEDDSSVKRPFPNSVWAAATFNFGPRTACFKHTDYANLPFGWCGITSLGQFDPRRGGHLVLWEAKRVVEFPAGSTVLVPSAAMAHSNVPIQRGERRYSFTQYTAGGIFRWVDQGFQTKAQHLASLSPQQRREEALALGEQLEMGLGLFSTMEELKKLVV